MREDPKIAVFLEFTAIMPLGKRYPSISSILKFIMLVVRIRKKDDIMSIPKKSIAS